MQACKWKRRRPHPRLRSELPPHTSGPAEGLPFDAHSTPGMVSVELGFQMREEVRLNRPACRKAGRLATTGMTNPAQSSVEAGCIRHRLEYRHLEDVQRCFEELGPDIEITDEYRRSALWTRVSRN